MRAAVFALLLAPTTAFAWPVQMHGVIEAQAPIAAPATVDLLLYSNGYGQGQIEVLGIVQQMPARWTWLPNRTVAISLGGEPFIGGVPSQGCLTGQVTRPMPAFLQPLLGMGTLTYEWDVCVVP